jgi:hypothetical protein
VDEFYQRVVADPALERFFEGTSLQRLKAHQFNFMRMAFTEIPPGMDVAGNIEEVTMLDHPHTTCRPLLLSFSASKGSSRQTMSQLP